MRIIITGAGRGIGRGIATVLARHGHAVGLLARSADDLAAVAAACQVAGGGAAWCACDLRQPATTETAINNLISALGGCDGLVNNAGCVIRKSVFELSIDEWQTMIETNVNGVFYATRAVLPTLRRQGHGHIVNISSISGRLPLPGGSGYAASKYAVTGFSESLFQEIRDFGIKVTTVFPGSVATDSHRHADACDSWKVTPEEVGQACCDLLQTGPGNCVSSLEIRPLSRPPKA